MGGTLPHLDMVTPIGREIIYFIIFGLRGLTRGRTAQDGDCDLWKLPGK